jgi:hypothetical protein
MLALFNYRPTTHRKSKGFQAKQTRYVEESKKGGNTQGHNEGTLKNAAGLKGLKGTVS